METERVRADQLKHGDRIIFGEQAWGIQTVWRAVSSMPGAWGYQPEEAAVRYRLDFVMPWPGPEGANLEFCELPDTPPTFERVVEDPKGEPQDTA
jgi:hypothetical protein